MQLYDLFILSNNAAPFRCNNSEDDGIVTMSLLVPGDQEPLKLRVKKIQYKQYRFESRYGSMYIQMILAHYLKPGVKFSLQRVIDSQKIGDL